MNRWRVRACIVAALALPVGIRIAATLVVPKRSPFPPLDLTIGERLCMPTPHVANATADRSIVIVADEVHCVACQRSRQATDELYAASVAAKIPVTFVIEKLPHDTSAQDKLVSAGRTVVPLHLADLGISREPSYVALDARGRILSMWTGNAGASRIDEMLRVILHGSTRPLYRHITTMAAEKRLAIDATIQAVSLVTPVTSALSRTKYSVIPVTELGVRAAYELDHARGVFVDCSNTVVSPMQCQDALIRLAQAGFDDVSAIGLPARMQSSYCKAY